MTASLVVGGGMLLLVWFAVLIGISMDTEAQRREWRRVARERRALREEGRPLEGGGLCADCPFRR
ncbi:hypothetical protein H7X46_24685 [Pseudonocardia sp. C8]|uniref:hypothetical protein n=1 Tax=Pseudonocardia sp. C8 TaxID=2762759 RepID=UPI001642B9D8|nr:hypothetical protein [Pseudonocardia sp. C8]MBC3194252.1 hypothetical protein [Pseudonocardia sp. C8]